MSRKAWFYVIRYIVVTISALFGLIVGLVVDPWWTPILFLFAYVSLDIAAELASYVLANRKEPAPYGPDAWQPRLEDKSK